MTEPWWIFLLLCSIDLVSSYECDYQSGMYLSPGGITGCENCPAGSFCPGDDTKTNCPDGTWSDRFAVACTPCGPGQWMPVSWESEGGANSEGYCQECGIGTYSTVSGRVGPCPTCDAGYYCRPLPASNTLIGAREATPCPAGTYSPPGSWECSTCPGALYTNKPIFYNLRI